MLQNGRRDIIQWLGFWSRKNAVQGKALMDQQLEDVLKM